MPVNAVNARHSMETDGLSPRYGDGARLTDPSIRLRRTQTLVSLALAMFGVVVVVTVFFSSCGSALSRLGAHHMCETGGELGPLPIYSNDSFISRIIPRSVPPPRTAASLKRHLCKIEGLSAPESCTLYLSLLENVPVDGATHLSLQGDFGPGLSSSDPVALVVGPQETGKRSLASVETRALGQVGEQVQTRYVHYRVYDENSEVTSKMSFDKDDTSLGHIEILSVPPPHTVASLKSCIIKSEGVSAHDLQVFEDDTGEVTLKDDDVIALLSNTYPGNVEEQPIAIVYKEIRTSNPATFTKKFKCKHTSTWTSDDPNWHSLKSGEIFYTDGILTRKLYKTGGRDLYTVEADCYIAINTEGKKGCVDKYWAQFC
ncbi:uncharacterized protein LACBIDRAFT_334388 [Laccaria bicolor S238N-H82]|uniref:Predicted protein n=1 Tax=Laccaria bicolor (strain S238N-H82 / ATCC MYA-4686) TaxID=486041 RepID=B0DZ22_LACBS|nr:uncharacterized protein LACBIDRAFT_334388 [Laccaria bicolor S238N-H82]EDR00157.1 predicted protein [Laccaria bicolor S238N-H82]|eukprot:XP_001889214.1 predicted protein [Laccaria bicolor S238N-H82]